MSVLHEISSALGKVFRRVHAGVEKIASHDPRVTSPLNIRLWSPAFVHGGAIPMRFTKDGEGLSPPIYIGEVPARAKELVLIVEDPDAPFPRPFVHWVAYRIDPDVRMIPEGARIDAGAISGRNSAGRDDYAPPSPPAGHGMHHYYFQIFALDRWTTFTPGATKAQLLREMDDHVVAMGVLVGTYERA